jgi:hypothetical protein
MRILADKCSHLLTCGMVVLCGPRSSKLHQHKRCLVLEFSDNFCQINCFLFSGVIKPSQISTPYVIPISPTQATTSSFSDSLPLGLESPFVVGCGKLGLCHIIDVIIEGRKMTDNFINSMLFWIECKNVALIFSALSIDYFSSRSTRDMPSNFIFIFVLISPITHGISNIMDSIHCHTDALVNANVTATGCRTIVTSGHEESYPLFFLHSIREVLLDSLFPDDSRLLGCVSMGAR